MKELKILIAEDTKYIGDVLSRTLSRVEGFEVVGVARDGVRAVEMARALRPHVLVLDLAMPYKSGLEVLKELRAEGSPTVIVMFTSDPAPVVRDFCLESGADYYMDKSQVAELIEVCSLHLQAL